MRRSPKGKVQRRQYPLAVGLTNLREKKWKDLAANYQCTKGKIEGFKILEPKFITQIDEDQMNKEDVLPQSSTLHTDLDRFRCSKHK